MTFTSQQLLRIKECLELRLAQLNKKRDDIDDEINEEIHELANIANSVGLELAKRRMKQ